MKMKEVMAIVRLNKVNQTKDALALNGFPAFTCRKVLGRGKKLMDMSLLTTFVEEGQLPMNLLGEHLTEYSRLIPKRIFTLTVEEEDVMKAVTTIMDINYTGNPGDGKIFVLPIYENYQVRTGEVSIDSY